MKKIYLITLLSVISFSLHAQEWKFGAYFDPFVGWGNSSSGSIKSNGSKLGYSFTLNGEKYFNNKYAFTIGLSYSNLGGKIQNIGTTPLSFRSSNELLLQPKQTIIIRGHYLGIPIGLKLKTPEFGLLAFYLKMALVPSIKLSGKANISGDKHKITKDLNFMTCAAQLGLGTMYPTGNDSFITMGLSFNYYFTDMLRGSSFNYNPINLGLHVGFLF